MGRWRVRESARGAGEKACSEFNFHELLDTVHFGWPMYQTGESLVEGDTTPCRMTGVT